MTDKSEKDKKEEQMSVANKVMKEDREVLKELCVDELDEENGYYYGDRNKALDELTEQAQELDMGY